METLKSMTGERAMMGRWYNLAEIGTHSQQRLKRINSVAVGLARSFQQISTISLIIGGYYLFDAGIITMGAIIAIVMLSSRSLAPDRKSAVEGKSVSVRVDCGGRRIIKKKNKNQ